MKEFVPYNPTYEIVFGFLDMWYGIIEFGHMLQSISPCSINKVVLWVGELSSHDTIFVLGCVSIVYNLFIFKADASIEHRPEWREAGTSKSNIPGDQVGLNIVFTKLARGTRVWGPNGHNRINTGRKLLVYDEKHISGQSFPGLHLSHGPSVPNQMVILGYRATYGFLLDINVLNYSPNTHRLRIRQAWWARITTANIEVYSQGHRLDPTISRVTLRENRV